MTNTVIFIKIEILNYHKILFVCNVKNDFIYPNITVYNVHKIVHNANILKNELMNLLIESKGFGLEAVKGQLFISLEQSDMPALMELRKSCVYSPNTFSFGRLSTVGSFIRYLRKTKK